MKGLASAMGEKAEACCTTCAHVREEEWTNSKDAMRCWAPGTHHGYTTDIYPSGKRRVLGRRDAPAWCPGYEPEA